MGDITNISWADHTFNPWVGCARVSPACDGCYAAHLMETRLGRVTWGGPGNGMGTRSKTSPANWRKPITWDRAALKSGTRPFVFCSSLADVFDNKVPEEWQGELLDLIRATPNLVWLLLTKRPQNIVKIFDKINVSDEPWPSNAAIGTTVEDQPRADLNVPALLVAKQELDPAFVFLSCEPLLEQIRIPMILEIDWVITGGETDQGQHRARPSHPEWFRSLRDQCHVAGIPYHHKQNGEWYSGELDVAGGPGYGEACQAPQHMWDDGCTTSLRVGKSNSGRLLDGVTHDAFPSVRRMPS